MGTRPLLSKTWNRAGHDPKHQREMIMSTMATPLSLIMYIFFSLLPKKKKEKNHNYNNNNNNNYYY
jgi:hypothetical protein